MTSLKPIITEMNRLLTITILLVLPLLALPQVDVCGKVIDKETGEPLAGASVMVKGADGKIKKFTTSKSGGGFSMTVPTVTGCRLEVSMMSFARRTLQLDSLEFPVTVEMLPGNITLKEVAVKADRIREQGDTVTYNVGSFAQKQDRSIGDVLKRMPGIDVAKNGKIQYQGEDINRFYIEGSDLLGGKYGMATNGINHDDVGSVEVMENHQPMQVLSGISFSDKAAINLKLKNKAKATWSFHGDAGGGWSWQPEGALWDGELFAMAVMPDFQNMTSIRTNNTGESLSASTMDFFAQRRQTALRRYISTNLPSAPSLNSRRTRFNRSFILSTNNLWKLSRGEFKMDLDYSFNRLTAGASDITTYFLPDDGPGGGDRVITENRDGKAHTHSLGAKFIYELNHKTVFANNTLQTNIDWNDTRLATTGTMPCIQSADNPDYYISNRLKMIKRFKGKHLITFHSVNEWESLPQTLSVSPADDKESGSEFRQHVADHAFFTHESVDYAVAIRSVTVGLEGGIKGCFRKMSSDMTGRTDAPESMEFVNTVNTGYVTLYASPKFEYWYGRVNFKLNTPLSMARYSFHNTIADRSEIYFSPSLSLNWNPNNRLSMTLKGGIGRSPMDLSLIHPGLIMTDYRSMSRGVDDFYNTSSQRVSASFKYKHTRYGIFANASVSHNWNHVPYTMSQLLLGDYVVYSYSDADNDSRSLTALCSLGKTLDFMRGSFNVNGFYRSASNLLSQDKSVKSIGTEWRAGAGLSGSPLDWLSIDYSVNLSRNRLSMNTVKQSWLTGMVNELSLTLTPVSKWQFQISGEHYRNELTADNYKNMLMLDCKLSYSPSRRVEITASLTNMLNRLTYSYTTYSELSKFDSCRMLRGRQLLLSVTVRK